MLTTISLSVVKDLFGGQSIVYLVIVKNLCLDDPWNNIQKDPI
jgi:hypothetical protein